MDEGEDSLRMHGVSDLFQLEFPNLFDRHFPFMHLREDLLIIGIGDIGGEECYKLDLE